MFELYPDQNEAVDSIHEAFKTDKRVLFRLDTGGGKTVIFTHISALVAKRFKRVCVISHRIELLTQADGTMAQFGLNAQIITAKTKHVHDVPVSVAMTGTLKNRLNLIKWRDWWDKIDLIIVDECHRSEFSWLKEYEADKYKLGVSATPLRSGKMPQLSEEYDTMIDKMSVKKLIDLGRLLPDNYIGVPTDLTGVKKDSTGDFNTNEMYEKFNNTKSYAGIVENWIKYANGLCTIVFCVNIQHCIETAKALNEAGIGAKFITSTPSKPNRPKALFCEDRRADWVKFTRKTKEYNRYKEAYPQYSGVRENVIDDWKSEKFPILINAGIAIEGFDHKPIKCVIVYLATTSFNKWKQMAGRGARVCPEINKKEFVLMDFGGNAYRLGHYQANAQFSLNHDVKISTGTTPYKNCPKCESLIFVSSMVCDFCGYEYPEKKEAEFIELVAHGDAPARKEMTFRELELMAQAKGYKSNWIWRTIHANGGEIELKKYAKQKGYSSAWVKIQIKLFKR